MGCLKQQGFRAQEGLVVAGGRRSRMEAQWCPRVLDVNPGSSLKGSR